jgi:hypothetical protein
MFWVLKPCRLVGRNILSPSSTLNMEIVCFLETLASIDESIRRQNSEDNHYHHHPHRRENLKSHNLFGCLFKTSCEGYHVFPTNAKVEYTRRIITSYTYASTCRFETAVGNFRFVEGFIGIFSYTSIPRFTNVIRSMKTVRKVKVRKYKIKFQCKKFWLVPDSQDKHPIFSTHVIILYNHKNKTVLLFMIVITSAWGGEEKVAG